MFDIGGLEWGLTVSFAWFICVLWSTIIYFNPLHTQANFTCALVFFTQFSTSPTALRSTTVHTVCIDRCSLAKLKLTGTTFMFEKRMPFRTLTKVLPKRCCIDTVGKTPIRVF